MTDCGTCFLQAARLLSVPVEQLCAVVGGRSSATDPAPSSAPTPAQRALQDDAPEQASLRRDGHPAADPAPRGAAPSGASQHAQLLSPATRSAAAAAAAGSPMFWQPLGRCLPGVGTPPPHSHGSPMLDTAARGLQRSFQASSAGAARPLGQGGGLIRPASAPSPTQAVAAAAQGNGGPCSHEGPLEPDAAELRLELSAQPCNRNNGAANSDGPGLQPSGRGWEALDEEEDEWHAFEGASPVNGNNGQQARSLLC